MRNPGVDLLTSHSHVFQPSIEPKLPNLSLFDMISPSILTAQKDSGIMRWERLPGERVLQGDISDSSMTVLNLNPEDLKKKFSQKIPLIFKGSSNSPSEKIFETLNAPKLPSDASKVGGPLEGATLPILDFPAKFDQDLRQTLLENLITKELAELIKVTTQRASLEDLKDENLFRIHMNMVNNAACALSKVSEHPLSRSVEAFKRYRKILMEKVTAPIKTESVRSVLSEARPFSKDLWSERTKENAVEAAQQSQRDQSFFITRGPRRGRGRGRPFVRGSRGVYRGGSSSQRGIPGVFHQGSSMGDSSFSGQVTRGGNNSHFHNRGRGTFRGNVNHSSFQDDQVGTSFQSNLQGRGGRGGFLPPTRGGSNSFNRGRGTPQQQRGRGQQSRGNLIKNQRGANRGSRGGPSNQQGSA